MAETKKPKAGEKKASEAPKTEERTVSSENLLDEVKKLVKEGNVQRIIVRTKEGKELLNLPVAVGIFALVFAPFAAVIAAVVGMANEFTLVIERRA
jgi:hypothetical protein